MLKFHGLHSYFNFFFFQMLLVVKEGENIASTLCTRSHMETTRHFFSQKYETTKTILPMFLLSHSSWNQRTMVWKDEEIYTWTKLRNAFYSDEMFCEFQFPVPSAKILEFCDTNVKALSELFSIKGFVVGIFTWIISFFLSICCPLVFVLRKRNFEEEKNTNKRGKK